MREANSLQDKELAVVKNNDPPEKPEPLLLICRKKLQKTFSRGGRVWATGVFIYTHVMASFMRNSWAKKDQERYFGVPGAETEMRRRLL